MCDDCSHCLVCDKKKSLLKFHSDAKKDLLITISMIDCKDYESAYSDEVEIGDISDDD